MRNRLFAVALCSVLVTARLPIPDPCATIAGKKWVSPLEARSCLFSAPLDEVVRANTIEVINKTLAFHTSTNYQVQAPKPFDKDIHEDLIGDLAKFSVANYASEFAFHLDIYRAFKRVNDGHCWVYNYCYDSLYITYLPIPLVLLADPNNPGVQNVHIAPEAYKVASAEFGEEMLFWEGWLAGQGVKLEELSGVKVILINGADPFEAVNANTLVTGGYQAFGTRQNAFFSSYQLTQSGWTYAMGNFALQAHPLVDEVQMVVQPTNSNTAVIFTIPYRSRFGSGSKNFTDYESWRANNCQATQATNGVNIYEHESSIQTQYKQHPLINKEHHSERTRPQPMNVLVDSTPISDIDLPQELKPTLPALNESYSVAQFYILNNTDEKTGVLALGSFSARNFTHFQLSLLEGLTELKRVGVNKLIVDVTNNGGGYVCIAHWLHRIIIGPSSTTEPQAGLDSKIRAGPLAQLIVKRISEGGDPEELLSYNPVQFRNATNHQFPEKTDWLRGEMVVEEVINGRNDTFSRRLGQECQPFDIPSPNEQMFHPNDVLIVSNGRCGSSCSLFSITMAKKDYVRTVVVGGKQDVKQQYCGIVGGQSTNFVMIDTEVKSTGLKNHSLAPPDFVGNVAQGITWRLGFGIDDPEEPEEWQDRPADFFIPLTEATVNNPVAIWEDVASKIWGI